MLVMQFSEFLGIIRAVFNALSGLKLRKDVARNMQLNESLGIVLLIGIIEKMINWSRYSQRQQANVCFS